MGATAAVKARLKALRRRYGLGEFSKKRRNAEAPARSYRNIETPPASWGRKKGVRKMAKKKSSRKGGMFGGGGIKSLGKALLVGFALTALTGRKEMGALGGFALAGPVGAAGGFFAGEIGNAVGKAMGAAGASGTSNNGGALF